MRRVRGELVALEELIEVHVSSIDDGRLDELRMSRGEHVHEQHTRMILDEESETLVVDDHMLRRKCDLHELRFERPQSAKTSRSA